MSLIHLEKSVLTFHLKEILEDGQVNHPLTWLGLGLVILAPKLLPTLTKKSHPVTSMSLSQWIAEAKKRELAATITDSTRAQTTLKLRPYALPAATAIANHNLGIKN